MTTSTTGAQGHTESAAAAGSTTTTTKTVETPAAGAAAPKAGEGTGEQQGTAAGTKTDEGGTGTKTPEGQAAAAPDFTKLVIPETGKLFIDQLVIDTVVDFARQGGWSLDDAQNALNEQALMMARADDAYLKQLKADPDYGGDKLAETQKLARTAIDLVRPEGHPRREAFFRTLNRVAGGNNPEVVAFLADLGKRASEDSFGQQSSATGGGERDAATVLYGGTTK